MILLNIHSSISTEECRKKNKNKSKSKCKTKFLFQFKIVLQKHVILPIKLDLWNICSRTLRQQDKVNNYNKQEIRNLISNSDFHLHTRFYGNGGDLLHNIRRAKKINNSLMDPKFKSIPSIGPCKPERKRVKNIFFQTRNYTKTIS